MPATKTAVPMIGHWDEFTDEQLMGIELTTDDPTSLPNLVTEIPLDHLQAHIEYTYNFLGSGRETGDMFVCVHGHHRHLHGAVMRVRDVRFLVGWICADQIYGENLENIRADYDAVTQRRNALIRIRDLRDALGGFAAWADDVAESGVLQDFDRIRYTLERHMTFAFNAVRQHKGRKLYDAQMPSYLCAADVRMEIEFPRMISYIAEAQATLAYETYKVTASIGAFRERIEGIVRRAELFFSRMNDVELFFQPATLAAICKLAENAKPKQKRYVAGLLSLKAGNVELRMPPNFRVPSRAALDALQTVIAG